MIEKYFIGLFCIFQIYMDEEIQCIRGKKTGAENIVKEIKQYQEEWLQHIQRMDTNRIHKQALQYKPKDEDT